MPNTAAGTLELVALELARALEPLANALHDSHHARILIAELGLVMPEQVITPALQTAFQAVHTGAHEIGDEAEALKTAIDAGNVGDIIVKGASLVRTIATLVKAFDTIKNEITALGSIPSVSAADFNAFLAGLPDRLFNTVVVDYLEASHQLPFTIFELLGLIERTRLNVGSTDPGKPEIVRKNLRFDRIGQLLQSPDQLLTTLYGWGQPGLDANLLLARIAGFLSAANVPVTFYQRPGAPPRTVLEVCIFSVEPTTAVNPPGLEATLTLSIGDGVSFELPFAEGWLGELSAEGALGASV
ncbi:MAG TPA: hypothetical protein VFP91_05520, partial [Vicinamibacterales bacterium]|nr:hypothetical protein [Vicinamibacterales bacterium]